MLKNWRTWTLIALFLGPYAAFIGLGFLWLRERGWEWVTLAGTISVLCGIAFTLLATRWSKSTRAFLPPIDWDAPQTFSEFDRQAWALVEAEGERGEDLDMAALTRLDTYVDTGRRLAGRLAAHYNPLSADPIERVAVVELLTAMELATEDLIRLCRQVPGGDLVTPADWKKAVAAAGYIQKASDIYTYLLPLFNPATGIPRLASQHLMVKPAWKSMQQNVLRWFHRAFVNRLGTHLVELYSGRLVIGSDQYRRLTRKATLAAADPAQVPLVIGVAGARDSGKSRLIGAIGAARGGDPVALGAKMLARGGDKLGLERLREARLVEVDGYSTWPAGQESARGRSSRRHAVAEAAEVDLLVLVVDARYDSAEADSAFVRDWLKWYADHPGLEVPPVLAVLNAVDAPELGGPWQPPHDWAHGVGPRESAVRARLGALREALPRQVGEVVPSAPDLDPADQLLPPLTSLCHRAERNALIRNLRDASARSRAGRLVRQVGKQGRSLLAGFRNRGQGEGAPHP